MIVIVGLSGKMRSGKDTLAAEFIKTASELGYEYKRIAFADALKHDIATAKGISIDELNQRKDEFREELIAYGAARRQEDPLYWVKRAIPGDHGYYILTDMRYRNEHDYLRSLTLLSDIPRVVYTVRIEALSEVRATRGRIIEDDISETDLDSGVSWDKIVFNNGALDAYLERCRNLTREVVAQLRG